MPEEAVGVHAIGRQRIQVLDNFGEGRIGFVVVRNSSLEITLIRGVEIEDFVVIGEVPRFREPEARSCFDSFLPFDFCARTRFGPTGMYPEGTFGEGSVGGGAAKRAGSRWER